MTTVASASTVVDDVVRLLADRVRGEVLDRVVIELLDADSERSDEDFEVLLHDGTMSGPLRRDFGDGCWLLALRCGELTHVLSRVRLAADAYRVPVKIVRVRGTGWALLPPTSRRWVDDLLGSQEVTPHLALLRQLPDLRLAPSVRRSLDELLDLGVRRGWCGLANAEQLETARRIESLLDLAASRPELVEGPLDVLLDDPHDTALAETLLAWFANDRDTAGAAAKLHLHVNTLRYRLRRVHELTGLDLSDWDQRLLAEIQLRLWDATRVSAGADF